MSTTAMPHARASTSGSTSVTRSLNRLAARQHGLLTRAQSRQIGLSDRAIDRRLESERWELIRPGVFVVGGVPRTWEQAILAVCLAGGSGTVVSHETSAWLWGLTRVPSAAGIHVTSSPERRIRLDGVIAHRSTKLLGADVSIRRQVPVTRVSRTIVDVSGAMSITDTGKCIDDALRRRLVTIDLLRACVARLAGPGRRRLEVVRSALSIRLPGYDPGDSNLEVRALRCIRRAGLAAPVQQLAIKVQGRRRRIDLAYPDVMVAIELDGWTWHGDISSFHTDRATRNELTSIGWVVLQITADATADDIVRWVRRTLAERSPRQAA